MVLFCFSRFMDVLFKEKSLVRRDFEDIDSAVKAVENGEVGF